MAQSVSNDALWEKLSELDKKLEQLSEMQKPSNLSDEQVIIKPDFQKEKNEIIVEIKHQAGLLGKHSDINFKAVNQNIGTADENIGKVFNIVARIRKQQKETVEQTKSDTEEHSNVLKAQANDNREYFNFRFFKVKKMSLIVAILGLLVFILTIFCMKQQNDYTLLLNEYYRQNIETREMQVEINSLRNNVKPVIRSNKKK